MPVNQAQILFVNLTKDQTMTTEEYFRRRESIRRSIGAVVPESLRRVDPLAYRMALAADSVAAAERIVRRCADKLSIPVVQSYRPRKADQMGFLSTTSRYTQGNSDPRTFDHRDPVPTGAVESFSPDAHKPKTRRRPASAARKVNPERVCKTCGVADCGVAHAVEE